ncbi:VWA domain-containing protein [Streptomyces poonensis]|uniref:VWFA domain-containing protein n=1 Tax=Streptomyces poonensis TaxID=68255 RepID=A0A918UIN5_9ACTN|nr:VWA domain-containing protein [Streptomyces poonensis]GGZ12777.1 hypothetical protein GCM10010365_35590 [Streptomyces poonensis]GLJ91986.1 hypothetical protein GCM10017589_45940 [Streptomyces poonensis]
MGILSLLRNAFGRSRKGRDTDAEPLREAAQDPSRKTADGSEDATSQGDRIPAPSEERDTVTPPATETATGVDETPKLEDEAPAPAPAPEPTASSGPEPEAKPTPSMADELVSAAFDNVTVPKPRPTPPAEQPEPEPEPETSAEEPRQAPPAEQPKQDAEPQPEPEPAPEPVAETTPEPAPTSESKPAPEPEPAPEPIAETEPEPVVESEPEPVPAPEPSPEPVAEAAPSPADETVPEPTLKPVEEAKPTSEPTPAAEPEPEPEPVAEASPASAPEPESAPEPAPAPATEPEGTPSAEPETKTEPQPATEAEAEADTEPQPGTEPEAKAEAEAEAQEPSATAQPEQEPTAEAEPEPKPEAEPEPKPEIVTTVAKKAVEPETETDAEPETEKDAEPEQPEPVTEETTTTGPACPRATLTTTAPDLVTAYDAAGAELEKHGLTGTRARVYLVLDRSASMRPYYKDGSAQALGEQALALAAHLDPEAKVHVVFFSTELDGTGELTLAAHENKIDELHAGLGRMGRTSYHAAVEQIITDYDTSGTKDPALVLFQTDGAPDAKTPATQSLTDAAKTNPSVFFSFIAFGDPENKAFDYLRKLKTGNTAHFLAGETPRELTDGELFEGVLANWRP